MKNSKIILIAMLLLPWLTLPLLGRAALKRYLPAAIFMCIFTKILDVIGDRKKWWRFYKGIPPLNSMDIFIVGPYFVTSLWILKFTYGKFLLYLLSNAALHVLFIFKGLKSKLKKALYVRASECRETRSFFYTSFIFKGGLRRIIVERKNEKWGVPTLALLG